MSGSIISYNVSPNPNDDTETSGVPIGAINLWGGSTAPSGWLLCNGANVSRTIYADLFSVIGTNFGAGNGALLPVTSGSGDGSIYTVIMPGNNNLIGVGDLITFTGTGSAFFDGVQFITGAPTNANVITVASNIGGNFPTPSTARVKLFATPTTFGLPNTLGRTVRGVGAAVGTTGTTTVTLGQTAGDDGTIMTYDMIAQHSHQQNKGTGVTVLNGGGTTAVQGTTDNVLDAYTSAVIRNAANTANAPTPPNKIPTLNQYVGINYIIKYG